MIFIGFMFTELYALDKYIESIIYSILYKNLVLVTFVSS